MFIIKMARGLAIKEESPIKLTGHGFNSHPCHMAFSRVTNYKMRGYYRHKTEARDTGKVITNRWRGDLNDRARLFN